jgi:hypothetical protein
VVTFLKQNQNVLLYAIYGDESFLVNLLNVVLLPPSTIAKIHLVRQGSGLDDKPLPQAQISVKPKRLSGKGKTTNYQKFAQHQNFRTPIKTRSFTNSTSIYI